MSGNEAPLGKMIIELGLDSANFSIGMKGVNQQIKTSMSQMTAQLNVLGKTGSELDRLKIKQDGLTRVVAAQAEKVSLAKEKYEAYKTEVEGNTEATQKQKDALIKAQNEYVKAIGTLGRYENELKEATIQITAMNTSLYQGGETLIKYGSLLSGVGKTIESVGKTLTLGVTAGVIALGTYSVKTGAEFDEAMSQVSAVSGAVGEELEQLRKKARDMGETTRFSASEAAEAMNYMAMAGWKTADMLAGIEGIMDLAAASGESLATTSDIVTDALTGFGKSAGYAGKLADIMAAASSNANTNVSMMGETFKYCTPIAGAMGFTMEDTAEAIGLMANSGIKASMAGTSLRMIMNNMAGDIKLTSAAMGETVIKTQDMDGTMRGLNDILGDCREAFSHMTAAEQIANAEALAGKNAMSGFLAIMNAAPSDIEKLHNAIENSSGAAKNMASIMQDNLNGQLTILKSQTDELAISYGEILMPEVQKIISGVQSLVDSLNKMDDGTKRTIVQVGLFAATVGPAVLVVGKLTSGVGKTIESLGEGARAAALWMAKISGSTAATTAATTATAANTAANSQNTAALVAKTAKTLADSAANKAHAVSENAKNIAIAAGNGSLTAQAAALNASISVKIKSTAATAAHTVAEKANALAMGTSTTGMTAHTVAVTISTAATNACAVATGLLSASVRLLLGPVGLIIAAIGALTVGVIAAVKWFTRETEEAKKLKGEVKELETVTNTLADTVENSGQSYAEHTEGIEANAKASRALADKIKDLSKVENKSAQQKKELKSYIDMLNRSTEGLNLKYNEQADALSMSTEEIYNQISAMKQQAQGQAAQERMVEVLKEEMAVKDQLTQIQEKLTETSENENLKTREKKRIVSELTEQEEQLNAQLSTLEQSYSHVSQVVAAAAEAEAQAVVTSSQTILESYGSIKTAYKDLGEQQKQALDDITAAYETMTGRLSTLTEKIKTEDKTTWEEIKGNQADVIAKTQEFSDLYATLIEAGVSDSYLNAIGATGPESIPLLKDMISQGVNTILESQDEWQNAYNTISDTLANSLEIDDSVRGAIKDYVLGESGIYSTLQSEIQAADLNALGKSITEGVQKGIVESTEEVAGAATDMAVSTTGAAADAWEINSPSKKFAQLGQYLIDGLVQGIENRENTVYAKAKAVADNVTNTLKTALEIHSPSAIMRDEIGKNIALGIAEGITQNKDYAKKSAEEIADAVLQSAQKKLDNTKVYQELTLADEAAYWDAVRRQVAEGTQAKIDADKKYFEAKKSLDQKMQNLEENYVSKVKSVYQNLENSIKSLQKSYKNELENRTRDIVNSMGLFQEFSATTELTTKDLIKNLRSQVDGLTDWTANLESLKHRGIGDDLLRSLEDMGTSAAGEVALMAQMTDEELQEYVSLFQTKQRLAGSQAAKELEPMREETRKQIREMRMEVEEELEQYKWDFVNAMQEIGIEIQTPLGQIQQSLLGAMSTAVQTAAGSVSTEAEKEENTNQFGEITSQILKATEGLPEQFNTLGENTIDGLIRGLKSKSGELNESMTGIIQEAIQTVRDTAQIHSPSRVMMSLGSYMLKGFGLGMEGMEGYVKNVAGNAASTVADIFGRLKGTQIPEAKLNLITSDTGTVSAISQALRSLTQGKEDVRKEEDDGVLKRLVESLAESNAKMIRLLEVIADKSPVLDKRSITNAIDTGLEDIKLLKVRGA